MSPASAAAASAPAGDDPPVDGLPWQGAALREAVQRQRGHALLLQGAAGDGALAFALALAQALLCDRVSADRAAGRPGEALACGGCTGCRLVRGRAHADLFVLLPETLRRSTGWPLADDRDAEEGSAAAKKKPSRQIRIAEVRRLVDWTQRTASQGGAKVALLAPADSLNEVAANALLKTLEEPPPGTRLLLVAADPALLLPTLASRCQRVVLPRPSLRQALDWLSAQGVSHAEVLLAAAAGRPLDARALAADGVDAAAWAALPAAVAHGLGTALAGWPVPRAVDALQKLCHDAMRRAAGASPLYFPAAGWPPPVPLAALGEWAAALRRVARHDDHPWNESLLLDALLVQARRALTLAA